MNDDETTTTDEAEEETQEEPTPIADGKAKVERVGSAGSSGASLVFECSLGDFIARGGTDANGDPKDPAAEVKQHIADEHGSDKPKRKR